VIRLSKIIPVAWFLIGAAVHITACGSDPPTSASGAPVSTTLTPVAQTAEWPSSTPEAERLDPTRLTEAVVRIRRGEFGRMNSLIVVRNERMLVQNVELTVRTSE
jgi:hypothetical protein